MERENEILQTVQQVDDGDTESDNNNFQGLYSRVDWFPEMSEEKLKRILRSTDPSDVEEFYNMVNLIMRRDDYEAVFYLLKLTRQHNFNEKGTTLYHIAYYGNARSTLMQTLSEWPQSNCMINYTDHNGLSFLHILSCFGSKDYVKNFLKFSENININAHCKYNFPDSEEHFQKYHDGFTPLHFAVLNHAEIVELLLEYGADLHAVDSLNRTPLHIACDGEYPCEYDNDFMDALNILIEYNSDFEARDNDGNTPLLRIFPKNLDYFYFHLLDERLEKLNFLIERGVDVTASNENGDNILHLIVKQLHFWRYPSSSSKIEFEIYSKYMDMIEKILHVGQGVNVNARNKQGETPLQLAVSSISIAIVKILLQHGADLATIEFDYIDSIKTFKYIPIFPNWDTLENLFSMLDLLIDNGFQLTLENNLAVLKFLVHDFDECHCSNLLDVLNSGSTKHINRIFNEMICAFDNRTIGCRERSRIIKEMEIFVHTRLIIGSNGIDSEILNRISNKLKDLNGRETYVDEKFLRELEREKCHMQQMVFKSNFTVHDMMVKHPYDIYQYIRDSDFHKCADEFPLFESAIKGHADKALARHHIETLAYAYLERLSLGLLPEICRQRILFFSSNEDILNLCLAATLEDD